MPWQEVVTVELRQQFVHDALRRVVPVTELCAAYGISRKTGYKFLARYDALGVAGLADQSRRPHRSPTALDPVLLQRLLEAHHRHPYWGPRKLLRLVSRRWPEAPWPVRSTVARCFQHLGLGHGPPPGRAGPARPAHPRRRWRRPMRSGPPTSRASSDWATAGTVIPLTVADGDRRYPARLSRAHRHQAVEARPVFERLSARTGCPADPQRQRRALRHDGARAPLAAERLVDPPRHPPRAHRARAPRAERPARAHAPDAQARSAPARRRRIAARSSGVLRSLSRRSTTRAPARGARAGHARLSCYTPSPRPYPARCRRSSIPATTRCGA